MYMYMMYYATRSGILSNIVMLFLKFSMPLLFRNHCSVAVRKRFLKPSGQKFECSSACDLERQSSVSGWHRLSLSCGIIIATYPGSWQ